MPKKGFSSLELGALVWELQAVVGGKLSQIYQIDATEILFQVHVTAVGKKYLKILPGKLLCFSEKKEVPVVPTSFCMQLRKHLDNASIRSIRQKDSERIVIFELEKSQIYSLIIELYSKGNVILTDEDYNTIATLQRQVWKDRTVKNKEKYVFPPASCDWMNLPEKKIAEVIAKSEKRNIASALATDVGLGGLYAQEVCKRVGISQDVLCSTLVDKQLRAITGILGEFLNSIKMPKGYVYDQEITPFALVDLEPLRVLETYSSAIDTINPTFKPSPYLKKIEALARTVAEQEEAILRQEELIKLNTRKGEIIYERYGPLAKLLDIVCEMRKEKDWKDVEVALRKEKKIKTIDLKKKMIVIDL